MEYSIVIVDDHDLVRGGLQVLIEEDPKFKVIAQFNNGAELLKSLSKNLINPDVIILDIDMPVLDGRETLKQLLLLSEHYAVLILSISGDDSSVLNMVRLGARGFLPKYCTRLELLEALISIINTGYYHSELERSVLYRSAKDRYKLNSVQLTLREIEFIRLVCDKRELPYKLIAGEMNVAFRTVDGYRESLFAKLEIKTKTGLVFYALREGIIKLNEI